MADFNVELSAPQGAGSRPVQPATTSILDNGVGEGIGKVLSIFEKGMEKDAKAKEKAFAEGILRDYSSQQGAISEAISTGGLTATAGASRSRALFNKFLASYPQFQKELSGLQGAFQAGTETGSAFDQVKAEQDLHKELVSKAAAKGLPVSLDQPKSVQDSWIRTYQQEERIQEQFTREEQRKAAMRAEGKYNQEIEDRVSKQRAERDLGELGLTTMESIFLTAEDYANRVRMGTLDASKAKLDIEKQMSKIFQSITLAGSANPELANMWRGTFERAREAAVAALDPNLPANEAKARADGLLNEARLRMLADPKVANRVAVSQAFGNDPQIVQNMLGTSVTTLAAMDAMLSPVGSVEMPAVTGTEADKDILELIKSGIRSYETNKTNNKEASRQENVNMVRQYLSQYGRQTSLTPDKFKASNEYFADPVFGRFIQENTINDSEMKPIRDVWQMQYEGPVAKAVSEALDKAIPTGIAPMRAVTGAKVGEEKPLAVDRIQVSFDGVNVSFGMKGKVDNQMGLEVSKSTKTLNESASAINQLIKVGAHMSGTTDYAAYFEKRKHIILPQFFSGYEGLEIGQVVNGKRYIGGDAKSPSSWKATSGN